MTPQTPAPSAPDTAATVSPNTAPVQTLPVYRAESFLVTDGVNLGDEIAPLDELVFDDIYRLDPGADRLRLGLQAQGDRVFRVAEGSECGQSGATLYLDCVLNFMSPDGMATDALVFVELDPEGHLAELYLLPLVPLRAKTDYTLVGADRDSAHRKLAQVACVSFTRGTHITMGNGAQVCIEDLNVGDRVLTRDDGVQQVRWIGQSTTRALGAFAPIVIKAGTLNNEGDLVVSPDHRLFVYQRSDEIGAGQSELMVKARHLVNGDSVFVQEGGFVEYFQILFDRHHILYAEGIAAESMLADPRTKPALPGELLERMGGAQRDGAHGLEVHESLLDRPDAVAALRRASTG